MPDSDKNVPIEVLYFLKDGINRSLDQCFDMKTLLEDGNLYFEMIESAIRFIEEADATYSTECLRDKLDVLKEHHQSNSILANQLVEETIENPHLLKR